MSIFILMAIFYFFIHLFIIANFKTLYKFPKFNYGNCLIKQKNLINCDPTNILYKFKDLPFYHNPGCILDDSINNNSKEITYSVVGIIKDNNDNVLLTRRLNSLKLYQGSWVFPGGVIEKNENFEEALVREIYEEVGIKIILKDNNKYYYNEKIINVKPLFLYEAVFKDFSKDPTFHTLIVFYLINLNEFKLNLKLNISKGEIDAYLWEKPKLLYNLIYDDSYKYYKIKGYIIKNNANNLEYFGIKNLKPNFINKEKERVDLKKNEYVLHSHRTAIKLLNNKM